MESLLFQANTANRMLPLDATDFQRFLKAIDSQKYQELYFQQYQTDQPQQVQQFQFFAAGIKFPEVIKAKFFSTNSRSVVLQLVNNALLLFTPQKRLYMQPPPANQLPVEVLAVHCKKTKRSLENTFNMSILNDFQLLKVSDRGDIFLVDLDNKCWFFAVNSAVQQFYSMNYQFQLQQDDVFLTKNLYHTYQHISAAFLPKDRFQSGTNDLQICCVNTAAGIAKIETLYVRFADDAVIDRKAERILRFVDQTVEKCVAAVSPLGYICLFANDMLGLHNVDFEIPSDEVESKTFQNVGKLMRQQYYNISDINLRKIAFSTDSVYAVLLFDQCMYVTTTIAAAPFQALIKIDNFTNLPVDCQFFTSRNLALRVQSNIAYYCINTPTDAHQLIVCGDRFCGKTMILNCHVYFSKYLLERLGEALGVNQAVDELILAYTGFMDAHSVYLQRIVVPCVVKDNSEVFQAAAQHVMSLGKEEQYIANIAQNALVAIGDYLFEQCKCQNGTFQQDRILFVKRLKHGFVSSYLVRRVFYYVFKYANVQFGAKFFQRLLARYNYITQMDYYEFLQMYNYLATVQAVHNSAFGANYCLLPSALAALSVALDINTSNSKLLRQFDVLSDLLGMRQLRTPGIARLPALFLAQLDGGIVFSQPTQPIFYAVSQDDFCVQLVQKYSYMIANSAKTLRWLREQNSAGYYAALRHPADLKAFIDNNLNQSASSVHAAVVAFASQKLVNQLSCPTEQLQELILASYKVSFTLSERCYLPSRFTECVSQLPIAYMSLFSTFGAALLLRSSVYQIVCSAELLVSAGYVSHAFEYLREAADARPAAEQRVLVYLKNSLLQNVEVLGKDRNNELDGYFINGSACGCEVQRSLDVSRGVNVGVSTMNKLAPEYRIQDVPQGTYYARAYLTQTASETIQHQAQTDGLIVNPLRNVVSQRPMTFERISLAEIMQQKPAAQAAGYFAPYQVAQHPPASTVDCAAIQPSDARFCAQQPQAQTPVNQAVHRKVPVFNQAENPIVYQMPPQAYFPTRIQAPPLPPQESCVNLPVFTDYAPNPYAYQQTAVPVPVCEQRPQIPVPLVQHPTSTAGQHAWQQSPPAPPTPPVKYQQVVVKRVKVPPQPQASSSVCSFSSDLAGPEVGGFARQRGRYQASAPKQQELDYGHISRILASMAQRDEPKAATQAEQQSVEPAGISRQNDQKYQEIDALRDLLAGKTASSRPTSDEVLWLGKTIPAYTDVIRPVGRSDASAAKASVPPRDQEKHVPRAANFDLSEHYRQLDNANVFAGQMTRYQAEPQLIGPPKGFSVSSDAGDFSSIADALRAIDGL